MATRVTEDDGSKWVNAEAFDELLAELKRLVDVVSSFIEDSNDPGVEALAALWCARAIIVKAEAA